ncbi:hypothetical protein CFAM422_005202 [Trichoderma lentiforme]|uniref:Uncharacterized protein n=1 Tax=Trichoderma lentiforme TaxID=1567552 RepID=A0A9P5CCI4_9HYPO|nr:hypothetical protein CFAM422_005202 [Trichoderma lentiforme]
MTSGVLNVIIVSHVYLLSMKSCSRLQIGVSLPYDKPVYPWGYSYVEIALFHPSKSQIAPVNGHERTALTRCQKANPKTQALQTKRKDQPLSQNIKTPTYQNQRGKTKQKGK